MPRSQFRSCLSPEEMNNGVGMLESGVFQRHTAGVLNVSQSVIFRIMESSSNPQRSFKLTWRRTRHDYNSTSWPFLLIQSRRQRFHNATSFNNEFRNGIGVRISTQTVRNRLHEFGLNVRIPVDKTTRAGQVRLCQNSRQMDYSCLDASAIH